MCPTTRARRDIYNEHAKVEKGCKIGLETSKVRINLRNVFFQNAARGPLKYGAAGPARRIWKMFISKKKHYRGRGPLARPGFFQDMCLCCRIHVMRRNRRVVTEVSAYRGTAGLYEFLREPFSRKVSFGNLGLYLNCIGLVYLFYIGLVILFT